MSMRHFDFRAGRVATAGLALMLGGGVWLGWGAAPEARGEAMLQYFNQSHNEIAAKIPELAEAGYGSIWIPPPTKANGGMSVGYDLFDPFDIGSTNLRGQFPTRYGTEADLHNLIETAHRFGIRVYFDNVMNHRAYDVPGYNESTPTDVYPGMVAEDFHLRKTSDGFYRKWDNIDWGNYTEWDVMFRPLSDLIDISHETFYDGDYGPCNGNFGTSMGDWHLKPFIVRHPNNPEFYDRMPNTNAPKEQWNFWDWSGNTNANLYTGFGKNNGITKEMLTNEYTRSFFQEDTGAYLLRAVRWLVDQTKVDGLRLDAVKHVPYYFFGDTGEGKDSSNNGYLGNAQWQFNMTRGFSDWVNHRDSVFDIGHSRDDLMMFGEHLGAPPAQGPYFETGMRLVDDDLRNQLNWRFSANDLYGYDNPGAGGFGPNLGVMHAQSHDNDYADRKTLQHAFYYMRSGLGLVYTDGNNRAATLSGSGGAFPRWACTDFLGQWKQHQIPELLSAHENFAMYDDTGKYSSGNFIAWERGGDYPWTRALVMFNSLWDGWQAIPTAGSFPATSPDGDSYLYNYASGSYMTHLQGEGWPDAPYAYGSQLAGGAVEMPPNSYAIWNHKNPDPSALWSVEKKGLSPVISVYDDGELAPYVGVKRVDGVDGDPDFNPNSVDDDDATDYAYTMPIPVVKGTNVSFAVRADGSAYGLMARIDGGMDFGNGISHSGGDLRDHPPGLSADLYLGFEDCGSYFVQRIWPEKFSATNAEACKIGSSGATTYEQTIGRSAAAVYPYDGTDGYGTGHNEPDWVWHDPSRRTEPVPAPTGAVTVITTVTTNTYHDLASNPSHDAAIPGFGVLQDVSTQDETTSWAGYFAGTNGIAAGLTGFTNGTSYGLYANPAGTGANAEIKRTLTGGAGLQSFSVRLGFLWDSDAAGSYKGFEVRDAAGNAIFGVNMGNHQNIYTYGTGVPADTAWSTNYGVETFLLNLTRTPTGYDVSGTTRDGGAFPGLSITTSQTIADYKVYMNATERNDSRQMYFDDVTYTSIETNQSEVGVVAVETNQFYLTETSATIWAKTSPETGIRMRLYYTTDGATWPEGAAGEAANRTTRVVDGAWKTNSATGSWWRFEIPRTELPSDTLLRYKLSAYRQQGADGNGWDCVWPGSADAITKKHRMLTQWLIPGLNLKTLAHHVHNDYNSETTNGLDEGFHLFTARTFLHRDGGSEIPNTFRQTFYVDNETPRGAILWPAADGETMGGTSYGLVVQTDRSVEEVWYHITDTHAANDGEGNGFNTNGVVEWAKATAASPWTVEVATNTAMPKLWKFNYNGIAPSGSATIRVRLREWSSAKTNAWNTSNPASDDIEVLNVTELTRQVSTRGDAEYVYFTWPEVDGTMVQSGWKVWIKYTARIMSGLGDEEIYSKAKVYLNAVENGSTNRGEQVDVVWSDHQWNWGDNGNGENQMAFTMPNGYNGDDSFLYNMTVELENNSYNVETSRLVKHSGPMLPTCIITTPPETDSDGIKYVIEMQDVPATVLATNPALRQTFIIVDTDAAVTNLDITFSSPRGYAPALTLTGKITNSSAISWKYIWTLAQPGAYAFTATATADLSLNTNLSAAVNSATRNATVVFRQLCDTSNTNDVDWDDDGIANPTETTQVPLPSSTDETWTQAQVFANKVSGQSDGASPDTDGDGLPDGLELGLRVPSEGTDPSTDTNGDGWPNFCADYDPPLYNTRDNASGVKGVSDAGTGANRTLIVQGTVTDPNAADSDYDGLPDGIEDANRSGWVEGDGQALPPDWEPWYDRRPPNGSIDGGETWEETAPGITDSDGDGLSDGYGEDQNYNGRTDMALLAEGGAMTEILFTNAAWAAYRAGTHSPLSRAVNAAALFAAYAVDGSYAGSAQTNGWPRLLITETDPLHTDTDHDGLPDGWENQYGLDPLDNDTYSFRTGEAGNPDNGASGNPDGDTILDPEGNPIPYTNLLEYQAGTNPTVDDSVEDPGGEGAVIVGKGSEIGSVNGTAYYREFLDWTLDDLVALDDYNQGGNSADIFRWGDGFDSSRDMVAFYFRDGGNVGAGGDGKLYFRVDFDNLQAYAESENLNIYVAMNFGSYGTGELNLPDEVNAGSYMKWNALVGVYDSAAGVLYRDMDAAHNTTAIGESYEGMGVETVENGFQGAYFNSELDAVAWSIDRAALIGAGWNGNPDRLMFQVYTVRDYTGDNGGSGDKGGRNDFTDTIGDDWLCSDYWNDYNYIANNGYYSYCIGRDTSLHSHVFNNVGAHANLALVAHGNQAIEPGSTIQAIVNNGSGAGYQRPVKIHNIYTNCPLNLHITPTLAMALEWAKVGTTNTWFSGPALNAEIRTGVAKGTLSLLASTFSDHILRYFPDDFNAANVALATETLNEIYGGSSTSDVVSAHVFWPPERVVDEGILDQIRRLGFDTTIVDQTPHLRSWFGRETALGSDAYKINRFWLTTAAAEMKAFVLSSAASDFRYVNTDSGLSEDLRHLFLRRARSGEAAISSIFYMWEDFASGDHANAYDKNLRWLANRPWIQVTTLDAARTNATLSENLAYHDLAAADGRQAQDWIQHACNEDYDNWFFGSSRHEGLAPKVFEIRSGTNLPSARVYGAMTTTNGILFNAWTAVASIRHADVRRLAEQTLFASVFESAFHNEENSNLSRWSYGSYIYPATGWEGLQSFAWRAQSRTRLAAVYAAVDDWAGRTLSSVEVLEADLDLDGEPEYVLRNNTLMALFEREGGLLIGAWFKEGDRVFQMVGNFAAIPENGYESEEAADIAYTRWEDGSQHAKVSAQRGSALKDVRVGSAPQTTNLYTVTSHATSLSFASGGLTKTISLGSVATNTLHMAYEAPGKALTVRCGVSPDLDELLRSGQARLMETTNSPTSLMLSTVRPDTGYAAAVTVQGPIQASASDQPSDGVDVFNTVNLRNMAQTRQIELSGTDSLAFSMSFTREEAGNLPPVLSVSPEADPQVFPVGAETSFTVIAEDPESTSCTLSVGALPPAGAMGTTAPSFAADTGVFSWRVTNLSQGSRTNDVTTNVVFTASDSLNTTSRTVNITIPWDADGDGMGDDWEYLKFSGVMTNAPDGDYDRDGFRNFSEFIAGTSPVNQGEYIGWESLFTTTNGANADIELTFRSVAGHGYVIQAADFAGLVDGGTNWVDCSEVLIGAGNTTHTTWTETHPAAEKRYYRIHVLP